MEEKKYYQLSTLERGLQILEAITENGEMTVTEVGNHMDINRASAHRFITTLRDQGFVRKNQHNKYEATFKMLELGMKQADKFEIRRIAKPYMRDLAAEFDETVNLGLLDQGLVIYLDKVESRELLRMDSGIGTSCPAYATAMGKAMLAFLPEEDRAAYMEKTRFTPITPHTVAGPIELSKDIAKIRKKGYAVDEEELALDLYCIGAPIFDFHAYPAFALSVSGPVRRLKTMKSLPLRILDVSSALSKHLGYRIPKSFPRTAR